MKKYLTELSIEKDQTILSLAQQVLERAGNKYDLTFLGPTAFGQDASAIQFNIKGDFHFHGTRYEGPAPKDHIHAIQIYRRQILYSCQYLTLGGIDIGLSDPWGGKKQLELAQIYVELNTKTQVPKEQQRKRPSKGLVFESEGKESRAISTLEATINNHWLVLLGVPGSGKSTFLAHQAFCLAFNGLSHKPQN